MAISDRRSRAALLHPQRRRQAQVRRASLQPARQAGRGTPRRAEAGAGPALRRARYPRATSPAARLPTASASRPSCVERQRRPRASAAAAPRQAACGHRRCVASRGSTPPRPGAGRASFVVTLTTLGAPRPVSRARPRRRGRLSDRTPPEAWPAARSPRTARGRAHLDPDTAGRRPRAPCFRSNRAERRPRPAADRQAGTARSRREASCPASPPAARRRARGSTCGRSAARRRRGLLSQRRPRQRRSAGCEAPDPGERRTKDPAGCRDRSSWRATG